jgi:hypothetical protein
MGTNERGESKLSSFIWLAVIATIGYAAWNVGPLYVANYTLVDKMKDVAKTPRWVANDEKIYDLMMKYVREEQMTDYVFRESFGVSTAEGHRIITCRYRRTVNVFPGVPHTFDFNDSADALTP